MKNIVVILLTTLWFVCGCSSGEKDTVACDLLIEEYGNAVFRGIVLHCHVWPLDSLITTYEPASASVLFSGDSIKVFIDYDNEEIHDHIESRAYQCNDVEGFGIYDLYFDTDNFSGIISSERDDLFINYSKLDCEYSSFDGNVQ